MISELEEKMVAEELEKTTKKSHKGDNDPEDHAEFDHDNPNPEL